MAKKPDDFSETDPFVTEFPKKGYGIVDYLQGRVHFALLDQMRLMTSSGMTQAQIKDTIMANITEIIDNFQTDNNSKNT